MVTTLCSALNKENTMKQKEPQFIYTPSEAGEGDRWALTREERRGKIPSRQGPPGGLGTRSRRQELAAVRRQELRPVEMGAERDEWE
jgi:hypothetical protein